MPSSTSGIEGITPTPPRVIDIHYGIFDTPASPGDTTTTVPTSYRLFTSEDAPTMDIGSVGDWYILIESSDMKVYQKTVGGVWSLRSTINGGGGTGDVVGPTSSVALDLPIFSDTTGKSISDSGIAIAGSGATASSVQVPRGNDPRMTDSRVPTTHATSHKSGGSDPIKLDELAAPTDVTTLNVTTAAHGLTPKLPNDATKYLDGTGNYTVPAGGSTGPITSSGLTMATDRLLGRTTALSGAIEEITIGANLTLSAGVLSATGGGGTWSAFTSTATGTQNDFAFSDAGVLYMNNATLTTITGLVAGIDGQELLIVSKGAGQVDIANQNGGSTAANQIINQVTGTISLVGGAGTALLVYDATTARWRVAQHRQGGLINVTYSAGNFTGSGSITWTVDGADQGTFAYLLNGKILTVFLVLNGTSVSGSGAALQVAIPNGFIANSTLYQGMAIADNGTFSNGLSQVVASGATIYTYRDIAGTNWSASTNNTYIRGSISFDIQ